MEMNEVLEKLPRHLLNLVIDQPYNEYTARDHSVWRYVMRQNINYLPGVAHHSYLKGLKKTGITVEKIPHMYGMNRILKEIGWAAVAVDGFIPPSAFMEFQAYNVLVIAADIRPISQIEYTPAPDILHEAAGHAPIIADAEYAEYLRFFGEIGSKAFPSAHDKKVYEAIRHLSILKADPYTPKNQIDIAEKRLRLLESEKSELSELALIRNLHWWTVEYGLTGDLKNPKIYGAGLLSSIGESYSSMQPEVKKIPYSSDAAHYNFDITTKQPHLFITPDFKRLTAVLDEFADTMALRTGGYKGLVKAVDSAQPSTCVLSSGLQIAGVFSEVIEDNGEPVYLKLSGKTLLAFAGKQLDGHGTDYHKDGFGSPVGRIKGFQKPPEYIRIEELEKLKGKSGKTTLEFNSGVSVTGNLTGHLNRDGKLLLLSFSNCLVTYQGKVLFDPAWGNFDMAIGERVDSVFCGPVDPEAFGLQYEAPLEKTHKIEHKEESLRLFSLYREVSEMRSENNADISGLKQIFENLRKNFPAEWLLPLEIIELSDEKKNSGWHKELRDYLLTLAEKENSLKTLINNGVALAKKQSAGN
ncbi:MAG: aromatic amino acid hydroxylase [Bacteroidales bacterium]|nr:aromatic amino acid hydroxylase [Bacteroidales bacterium]